MADICPFVGYLGGEWVKAVDIGELAVLLGVEIVVLVGSGCGGGVSRNEVTWEYQVTTWQMVR